MKMAGKVIFSVERSLEMSRVYIRRRSDESWLPDFISPRSGTKTCVMIWRCISQHGFVTLCRVNGYSNSKNNTQVFWIITCCLWQKDNFPIITIYLQMIMHLFIGLITTSHCLSSPQSPDLNSTENVWFKGKYAVFNGIFVMLKTRPKSCQHDQMQRKSG